jgi:hypothetical protein
MNIAFPALLIALLILPGAIFRYGYARGSWGWTSPISFRSISDELAYSAVFAVGLHFLWQLLSRIFGYSADFRSLVALLSGSFGLHGERYEQAIRSIADHPTAIAIYFLSLACGSAAMGRASHRLVRATRLDLSTQIFRFRNEWHYLLTGEVLSFKEVSLESREVDGVYLSAVVDHSKDTYLYRGIVEDWSFDQNGRLETIRLRLTHRRLLSQDRSQAHTEGTGAEIPPDARYYKIHGDLFVLRYSEIKTLNLDYFSLSEEAPRSTPVAARIYP